MAVLSQMAWLAHCLTAEPPYYLESNKVTSPFLRNSTSLRQVPIPITEGLDPLSLLTDDADVATWNNQGLPSDRMSTENATILCNTERWPLIVDAQLQGIKWIKNKYGEELKAIRLGQKRCVTTVQAGGVPEAAAGWRAIVLGNTP